MEPRTGDCSPVPGYSPVPARSPIASDEGSVVLDGRLTPGASSPGPYPGTEIQHGPGSRTPPSPGEETDSASTRSASSPAVFFDYDPARIEEVVNTIRGINRDVRQLMSGHNRRQVRDAA